MNVSQVAPFTREWLHVLRDYKRSGQVRRDELIDAMESQNSIPSEAKELLTKVAAGTLKFKKGVKPHRGYKRAHWIKVELMFIEAAIDDPDICQNPSDRAYFADLKKKATTKHRDRTPARDSALQILAERHGTDIRTIERILAY